MFGFSKLFAIVLVAGLSLVSCGEDTIIGDFDIDLIYSDRFHTTECTLGNYGSNLIACKKNFIISYPSRRDIDRDIRCPDIGTGRNITYIAVIFGSLADNANCTIPVTSIHSDVSSFNIRSRNTSSIAVWSTFYY